MLSCIFKRLKCGAHYKAYCKRSKATGTMEQYSLTHSHSQAVATADISAQVAKKCSPSELHSASVINELEPTKWQLCHGGSRLPYDA